MGCHVETPRVRVSATLAVSPSPKRPRPTSAVPFYLSWPSSRGHTCSLFWLSLPPSWSLRANQSPLPSRLTRSLSLSVSPQFNGLPVHRDPEHISLALASTSSFRTTTSSNARSSRSLGSTRSSSRRANRLSCGWCFRGCFRLGLRGMPVRCYLSCCLTWALSSRLTSTCSI